MSKYKLQGIELTGKIWNSRMGPAGETVSMALEWIKSEASSLDDSDLTALRKRVTSRNCGLKGPNGRLFPYLAAVAEQMNNRGEIVAFDYQRVGAERNEYVNGIRKDLRGGAHRSIPRVSLFLETLCRFFKPEAKAFYHEIGKGFPDELDELEALEIEGWLTVDKRLQSPKIPPNSPTRLSANTVPAPPVRELVLDTKATRRRFHYTNTEIPVLGRQEEEQSLNDFLGGGIDFRWLQIAGAGGQGKSRLAYELMKRCLKGGWHAGFLQPKNLKKFSSCWEAWEPHKNTLIIIDYVLGNEEHVKTAIQALARRKVDDFRYPVRLLLLERQRWDRGVLEEKSLPPASDDGAGTRRFEPSLKGKADWFVRLCDEPDGEDRTIHDCCHGKANAVVELQPLKPHHLVRIVRNYARDSELLQQITDSEIACHLARIDRTGRPLIAYLLASTIKSGSYDSNWTQDDLLREVIEHDQAYRWKGAFLGRLPLIGDNILSMRLAVLATMIDGLDWRKIYHLDGWTANDDQSVRQAIILNDGHLGKSGSGQKFVPPLLPDILGEWFVLECLDGAMGTESKTIVECGWQLEPEQMFAFLVRCFQDFPENQRLLEIREYEINEEKAAPILHSKLLELFGEDDLNKIFETVRILS